VVVAQELLDSEGSKVSPCSRRRRPQFPRRIEKGPSPCPNVMQAHFRLTNPVEKEKVYRATRHCGRQRGERGVGTSKMIVSCSVDDELLYSVRAPYALSVINEQEAELISSSGFVRK
jgi:hypothetical protein